MPSGTFQSSAKLLAKVLAFVLAVVIPISFLCPHCAGAEVQTQWIRPMKPGDPLLWGRKDGLIFGLPSDGGLPGPRGLIRVGMLSARTGSPELLNYVAIEPVTTGRGSRGDRMAFSELEMSLSDAQPGKRLWVEAGVSGLSGELSAQSGGQTSIETLTVRIEVERFQSNGAHVYVIATVASDHPQELRLSVYRHDDSPEIEELTLTATMGNYERLRWLWLKDQVVDSREIYRGYKGDDFAEHATYPLKKMLRAPDGDAIVFCTTNEAHPESNPNFAAKEHWRYRLTRTTQYWRVRAADIEPNLRVRVNGRRVYWNTHSPVGGGIAFENFEVRQKYKPGQTFVFGFSTKEPWEFEPHIAHLAAARIPEVN